MLMRHRLAVLVATVAAFTGLMVAFGIYQPQREASDTAGELVWAANTASTAATQPHPSGSPLPTGNLAGDPAIPVSPNAKPGEPAFGEKEVYAYFDVHPPDYWDNSTPMPEVTSIQFLSTREAEVELDTSIPRPPGYLLYTVKLKGSFIPRIPPRVTQTYLSTPVGGVTVAVVIDALTGNILGQAGVGEMTPTTPAEPLPTISVPAGLTYSTCLPDVTPGIHTLVREKGLLTECGPMIGAPGVDQILLPGRSGYLGQRLDRIEQRRLHGHRFLCSTCRNLPAPVSRLDRRDRIGTEPTLGVNHASLR